MLVVGANKKLKEKGEGSLERMIVEECGSRNNKQVKEDTKCCETNNNTGNYSVDGEEVVGEGIAKEEESNLEHER